MSKPYSPAAAPEFATQHEYSDILGTSTPNDKPSKLDAEQSLLSNFEDPWGDDASTPPPVKQDRYLSSDFEDPWASDTTTNPQSPSAKTIEPPTRSAPTNSAPVQTNNAKSSTAQRQNAPAARQSPPSERPSPAATKVAPPATATPATPPAHPAPQTAKLDPPAQKTPVVNNEPAITARDLALQYCQRGNKSLAAKDYAQARSAYKIAIEWDPQLASAHCGIAQVCDLIQDYEGALIAWDLAIKCDSTQLDWYYQRALVQKTLKNYFHVLADCKRILEHSPHHSSARWLNAVALVKVENYQIALFSLNQHVDNFPQDPNGYCYRGICYERLEQLPQALADFDRAIELQARQPVFHHARGRTRQKLGDLKGALADFNLTIDLKKPRATVYDDRAEVHRCLGNHVEAVRDCDRAIELNPNFTEAYFRRGLTYTEMGNLELASINYTKTIDLEPHHVNAWIQRSWIYFRQQDYSRAKLDCQAVNAFDKSCFWSHYMLGVVNSLLGLKNNAITNFSTAIEISSNYVSARYHRGIIYHELGDIPKAMEDFKQARSLQDRGLERLVDRDETGFYAEGLALHHLGQSEAARTVLLLGALSAKRFNNPSFHQLILSNIAALGLTSGTLDPDS